MQPQLDALRKDVNSLKLFSPKKREKTLKCLEFSRKGTCSVGFYCKNSHKYRQPPRTATYGGSELRLTDLGTRFFGEVRLFLDYASVYACASIKVVDVSSRIMQGYQFLLNEGLADSDGLFVASFDSVFERLEVLFNAQSKYFLNVRSKTLNEGEDFCAEKTQADAYVATCNTLLSQLQAMMLDYRSIQRRNKNILLAVTPRTHPTLITALNVQIDEYFSRVCESMLHANVNNRQIISALSSCISNYFAGRFFPSVVPFGSAANQLGNIQYSDLDLSLTLLRYNANGVGLSEVPIVNDNLSVHKGRRRVAVMTEPVPPGGMKMSEVLKEVRNALYRYNRQFLVKEVLSWARVPIIKLVHIPSNIEVDVCVGNRLAVKNTELLREFAYFDVRAHKLMLTVKYWAASRKLNKARNGTLSSYGWVLMVIYYLQTVNVLPSFRITNRAALDVVGVQGVEFELLPLPFNVPQNTDTAAELLIKFFAFYGIQNAGDCGQENINEYRSGFHALSIRQSGNSGEKKVLLKSSATVLELMQRSKKDKQEIGGENGDDDDEDSDDGEQQDASTNINDSLDDVNNDFLKEVDSDGEVVTPSTPASATAGSAAGAAQKQKTPEDLLKALDLWYKFTIQDPFEEHDLGRVIQNPDVFGVMINELGRAAKILVKYSHSGDNACRDVLDTLIGVSNGPSASFNAAHNNFPSLNSAPPSISKGPVGSHFTSSFSAPAPPSVAAGSRVTKQDGGNVESSRKDRRNLKQALRTVEASGSATETSKGAAQAKSKDDVSDDVERILLANLNLSDCKKGTSANAPNPNPDEKATSGDATATSAAAGGGKTKKRWEKSNKQPAVGGVATKDLKKALHIDDNAVIPLATAAGAASGVDSGTSSKKPQGRSAPQKKQPPPNAGATDSPEGGAETNGPSNKKVNAAKKGPKPPKQQPSTASTATSVGDVTAVSEAVKAPLKSKRPQKKNKAEDAVAVV